MFLVHPMTDTMLRALPSVDVLLQHPHIAASLEMHGRPLTIAAVRETLDIVRAKLLRKGGAAPGKDALARAAVRWIDTQTSPTLRPVLNATGVIIHTNLGRAPLSIEARQAMFETAGAYNTLEYNIGSGRRSKRFFHVENTLCQLTGAEAALVVNNNAAALLLVLTALARRKGVVISRSQLVEIGGGFRVPDVMKQSGAKLIEVGTTNRTHKDDFVQAIGDEKKRVALILRAHHSNFRIVGFTSEPTLSELVEVGKHHCVPVVDDLGSGALLDTSHFNLGHEPMVQESLANGADIVCFSGDKLLGGPQAGIILGRSDLVRKLARHPLTRAVRPDKLCLAGLSATLLHYLKDEALRKVPVWRMIDMSLGEISERAGRLAAAVEGKVIDGSSTVGGGSLPEETLPTRLVALSLREPQRFAARLRRRDIIARIKDGDILFDLRTVPEEHDQRLASNILEVIEEHSRQMKH